MATEITNKEHLKTLISWLEKQQPESVVVYSVLRNMSKGRYLYYKIYVDEWPNRNVVAVVPDRTSCKNKFWCKRVFLYGTDTDRLLKLVHTPGVLDWTSQLEFYGISLTLWNCLEATFKLDKDTYQQDPDDMYMYYIQSKNSITNVSKPEGLDIGPMNEEATKMATCIWKFNEEGFDEYLEELAASDAFTLCLYDQTRRPVGWVVQHFCGEFGMLYVEPEYRRKGCGRFLLASLLKLVVDRDGFACSTVETYNASSLKLHESVGMKKLETERFLWQRFRYKLDF